MQNLASRSPRVDIDVQFASALPPSRWQAIADLLSEQSRLEQHILFRAPEYFLQQIRAGRMLVALLDDELIGTVCLHRLSDAISEIGSAWVAGPFRGGGVYSALKDAAVRLAQQLGLDVVSTAKVTPQTLSPSLNSSMSRGMLPVSFQSLAQRDRDAFHASCCCDANRNYRSCAERDQRCILSAKVNRLADMWPVMQFISSPAWRDVHIGRAGKLKIYQEIANWRIRTIEQFLPQGK